MANVTPLTRPRPIQSGPTTLTPQSLEVVLYGTKMNSRLAVNNRPGQLNVVPIFSTAADNKAEPSFFDRIQRLPTPALHVSTAIVRPVSTMPFSLSPNSRPLIVYRTVTTALCPRLRRIALHYAWYAGLLRKKDQRSTLRIRQLGRRSFKNNASLDFSHYIRRQRCPIIC